MDLKKITLKLLKDRWLHKGEHEKLTFNYYREYFTISIICALVVVFGIWAYFTTLDLVTIGTGRVVAAGQNIKIQAFESGSISLLEVKENDKVKKNDLIVKSNPISAKGMLTELRTRLENLQIKLHRLNAELKGTDAGKLIKILDVFPSELAEAEISLFQARKGAYLAKLDEVLQKKLISTNKLVSLTLEADGILGEQAILEKEMNTIIPLVKQRVLSQIEEYRLEKDKNKLKTRASIISQKELQLKKEIEAYSKEQKRIRQEFLSKILEEKTKVMSTLSELKARVPAIEQRLTETEVRSPINGVINRLFINAVGAVVQKGDLIAEIVPTETELLVEAFIDPENIAQIQPGQPCRISLTAYDPGRYGYIDGIVKNVAADTIFRKDVNRYQYAVTVEMNIEKFINKNPSTNIINGLVAQVNIIRGARTILEYFWQPVAKIKDRAFRE